MEPKATICLESTEMTDGLFPTCFGRVQQLLQLLIPVVIIMAMINICKDLCGSVSLLTYFISFDPHN